MEDSNFHSNTATGLAGSLYDEGRRSRCTGKERDSESGLDFFGARYYGSALGRFTSVDPVFATASLFNPQSWNGYSYTLNNPLKFVDPTGGFPIPVITGAIGAGIGGVASALNEIVEERNTGDGSLSAGRIATAFGGGAVAGGLAGLTLGIGAASGVAAGAVEVATVSAETTIIGDVAQDRANDLFGLSNADDHQNELAKTLLDGTVAAFTGVGSSKLADKLIPIPNVRKQIALLQYANRRSTRPARIAAASFNGQVKAALNASIGGTTQSVFQGFWSWLTGGSGDANADSNKKGTAPAGCASEKLNGQDVGGSCPN